MSNLTPRIDKLEPNRVYNGNFDVWQRGLSFTAADNAYKADRWRVDNTQANTHSRESTGKPTNASYFWRTTFAAGGAMQMFQAFEYDEVQMFKGNTYTVIFKMKRSSDFVGEVQIRLQTNAAGNTSIGGGWTNIVAPTVANADIQTGTWTQYKVAVTIPTDNDGFRINFVTDSIQVAGATLDIAQVMMLPGDLTSIDEEIPFRRAGHTIGHELSMIQRFGEPIASRFRATLTSGSAEFQQSYNTTKRIFPSIVNAVGANISFIPESVNAVRVTITASAANGSAFADAEI